MMREYITDALKPIFMISRGNHDTQSSESMQTQRDIEEWLTELKITGGPPDTWISAKQLGNVYIINMDSEDMDVKFKRDQ